MKTKLTLVITEALREEFDKALYHALHSFSGAKKRWSETRATGANDEMLSKRIAEEFGIDGGYSGPGSWAYRARGGNNPRFEFTGASRTETFEVRGKELLSHVRRVLQIGNPSVNVGDMSHENFMKELDRLSPEISYGPLFENVERSTA